MEPLQAIQLATLNAAECYGLSEKVHWQLVFKQTLLFWMTLKLFNVAAVWKKGVKVAEQGVC